MKKMKQSGTMTILDLFVCAYYQSEATKFFSEMLDL